MSDGVFPAHAGMFRTPLCPPSTSTRFPRARGDVPWLAEGRWDDEEFSPRTRGCSAAHSQHRGSNRVFPAHAGMFLPPAV